MKLRKASGVSGFDNENLIGFVTYGCQSEYNINLITLFVIFILRGWLNDDDWIEINKTRLIGLNKGGFEAGNDSERGNGNWRPICISEPIMIVAELYF